MTRATKLLLHGDLDGALLMHPLVLVLAPWSALLLAGELWGHVRSGTFSRTAQSRFFRVGSYVVFALAIAVWASRFLGAFGGPVPD